MTARGNGSFTSSINSLTVSKSGVCFFTHWFLISKWYYAPNLGFLFLIDFLHVLFQGHSHGWSFGCWNFDVNSQSHFLSCLNGCFPKNSNACFVLFEFRKVFK